MPGVEVVVSPCTVQGEQAPASIVKALRLIQEHSSCQVIILGRGGGASEDLSAFNDENVVREVAACRVPVVSAVGHEVDLVLSDLAADARAPTPTAAAQMVVPDRRELQRRWQMLGKLAARALGERLSRGRRHLVGLRQRLADPRLLLAAYRLRLDDSSRSLLAHISRLVSNKRRLLQAAGLRLVDNSPEKTVEQKRRRLMELGHRSAMVIRFRLQAGRNFWQERSGRLHSLDPRAVLRRGFAQVCDLRQRVIVNSREISSGEQILIRLWRGRLQAEVNRSWPEEEEEN
jgi:exodeoxyribonuclease VII large subunit